MLQSLLRIEDRSPDSVYLIPAGSESDFMGEDMSALVGKLVEVHLLNGSRYLGKVKEVDAYGVTVFCIPLSMLEGMIESRNIVEDLRAMRHTLFFPHTNIEYIDVGGEPLGFDHLFHTWFGNEPLDEFFAHTI